MPELPEVEVVRRGLVRWVVGCTITGAQVLHPRAVRRHLPGAVDLAGRLAGARVLDAVRRGKYLWLPLAQGRAPAQEALVAHLGMSGQLVVRPAGGPDEKHLRVRLALVPDDGGRPTDDAPGPRRELRFVDQRTFGGLAVVPLVPTPDGLAGGAGGPSGRPSGPCLPQPIAHIARDVLDPFLDVERLQRRMRARRTVVKRALLDQSLVSGIGNIYADEALWWARLSGGTPTSTLGDGDVRRLLDAVRAVMTVALDAGGTSFDGLYVDVNGRSGYFGRSLAVYGRAGRPCARCGTPVRREAFMNRSSFSCPTCQPPPAVG